MTTRLPIKRGKQGGSGDGPPPHPLALAIDQLYAAGATPRLVLDARRADVIVPEFLRTEWGKQLVIDLKASDPLDLVYDAAGVNATLSFGQLVTRCTFAWASIYQLIDRGTGRGIVIGAHEPPDALPPELAYEPPPSVTEIAAAKRERKASFSLVSDRDATPAKEEAPLPKEPDAPTEAKPLSASDEEAKARRAKFRVIEGG